MIGTIVLLVVSGGVGSYFAAKFDLPRWQAGALTLACVLVAFAAVTLWRKRREK